MERKSTISPVSLAAMRLLAPKTEEKPKPLKSERRLWGELMSVILHYYPFPPKQKRLLKAFVKKRSLDSIDIKVETGSKDPRGLIRDTRKKIKSYEYLRDILDIGNFRKGKKWFHYPAIILSRKK